LRADEVRRARQARAASPAGSPQDARSAQPAPDAEYGDVPGATPKRRWTPVRLGLLATGLSLVLLAAIFVVPVLIQMQRTADQVFQDADPRIDIIDNPEGTPIIVTQEPSGNVQTDDDFDDESADLPDWDGDDRINIALYGIDSREEGDSARSDTIIIVTIDPSNDEVGMFSIPRDLQVEIPGLGTEKINAAYAQGGRALTRAVVEYHFNIDIHYYAEVDFNGFISIIDTIGGIVVDNPAVLKDDNYEWTRVYFATGPQYMDGETALRYVRTRYDDNDFARGQRQQQVLRALRQQGVRLNLITRVRSLLQDVEENFRTDLSMRQSLALARMANDLDGDDIVSYSIIECTSEDYVPDLYYYLIPDWDCIHALMEEIMPARQVEPDVEDDEPGDIDHNLTILIENGTFIDGLAGRSRNALNDAGFELVEIRQAADAGNIPESTVHGHGAVDDTAREIARRLGLDLNRVQMHDEAHPDGFDIVVVLGEDAPDPDSS
jgi:polyisoprenyl-teichoic acid--peptidoglycan teichoic acid transferase